MGFLSTIFESRASVGASVNISNGGDPALAGMFGGTAGTASGQNVNADTALKISTVWACMNRRGKAFAMLPLHVMKELPGNGHEIAKTHRLYKQMHLKPNAWQTSYEWRLTGMTHLQLRGNFYNLKISTPGRGLNQLVPLDPDRMWPFVITPAGVTYYMNDSSPTPPAGSKLFYQYFAVNAQSEIYTADEILHFRNTSTNGIVGKTLIRLMAESVGLSMAMEEQGARLFTNGAQISKVFTHPNKLDDSAFDRLKKQLDQYTGSQNAHRTIILENGMDISSLSMTMQDSQFLECVTPTTAISMADGTLKYARDIQVNDEILGWDDKLVKAKVSAVGVPKLKNIFRIITARNRKIEVSEDHPFLSLPRLRTAGGRPYLKGAEWTAAKDLKIGSYVKVALGNVFENDGSYDPGEAYFLGAMTGDGYIRSLGCSFTCADTGIVDRMTTCLQSMNGDLRKNNSDYGYDIVTNGVGCKGSKVRTVLNESGLIDRHAHNKRVPRNVLQGGKTAWVNFIAGYFDTDGSVRPLNGKYNPALYIASINRNLLVECQYILSYLGIQSIVYKAYDAHTKIINGKESDAKTCWSLYVTDSTSLRLFAELIPSAHSVKSEALKQYRKLPESRYRDVNTEYDRVVGIECLGMGETIGIEVEGCHTHVTAGLITHNCRKFQVEDICSFLDIPMMLIHRSGDKNQTFASAEVIMQMFITLNMQPDFENFEQRLKVDLLYDSEQEYYFNFDFDELMRGDTAARASYYTARFGTGSITPNDIKRKEGESPYVDKPECDAVYMASGMQAAKNVLNPPEPVAKPEVKVEPKVGNEDASKDEK